MIKKEGFTKTLKMQTLKTTFMCLQQHCVENFIYFYQKVGSTAQAVDLTLYRQRNNAKLIKWQLLDDVVN